MKHVVEIPASNGVLVWTMACWNVAAQAASMTTSYSEPVDDGLFTMEGTKKTITLLIRKACDVKTDIAGNGSDAVVAETGGIIGIPVLRSPGATDRLKKVVRARHNSVMNPRGRFLSTTREPGYAIRGMAAG